MDGWFPTLEQVIFHSSLHGQQDVASILQELQLSQKKPPCRLMAHPLHVGEHHEYNTLHSCIQSILRKDENEYTFS